MSTPRESLAAVLGPDNSIYAIGGDDGSQFLSSVEKLAWNGSSYASSWTPSVGLGSARNGLAAATGADGRIYVTGEFNDADYPSGCAEANDGLCTLTQAWAPGDPAWTQVAPLGQALTNVGAVRGPDGRVYAVPACRPAAARPAASGATGHSSPWSRTAVTPVRASPSPARTSAPTLPTPSMPARWAVGRSSAAARHRATARCPQASATRGPARSRPAHTPFPPWIPPAATLSRPSSP